MYNIIESFNKCTAERESIYTTRICVLDLFHSSSVFTRLFTNRIIVQSSRIIIQTNNFLGQILFNDGDVVSPCSSMIVYSDNLHFSSFFFLRSLTVYVMYEWVWKCFYFDLFFFVFFSVGCKFICLINSVILQGNLCICICVNIK